jgi:hypothetical protein
MPYFRNPIELTTARPRLRDATVTANPPPTFDAFFLPLTSTYSVNWPHAREACFVRRPCSRRTKPGTQSSGDPPLGVNGVSPSMAEVQMFLGAVGDDAPGGGGDEDDVVDLAPEFEAHVRDISNWTLGHSFAEAFPQWRNCVLIKN